MSCHRRGTGSRARTRTLRQCGVRLQCLRYKAAVLVSHVAVEAIAQRTQLHHYRASRASKLVDAPVNAQQGALAIKAGPPHGGQASCYEVHYQLPGMPASFEDLKVARSGGGGVRKKTSTSRPKASNGNRVL
jgi:hypothetical protein